MHKDSTRRWAEGHSGEDARSHDSAVLARERARPRHAPSGERVRKVKKKMDRKVAKCLRALGEATKKRRLQKGLTIAAAAARAGLHPRHYQKLEAGEANATLETLARIARAYSVDPARLWR